MNKSTLLLLLVFPLMLSAQVTVDTGKVWSVVICLNQGVCGTTSYSFAGDTTIGIHQYKKLDFVTDGIGTGFFGPIAAREDTQARQVFFYYQNSEALAYDFSLNPGDTFSSTPAGCPYHVEVLSVDTVTLLNGETRKRMHVATPFNETWIEGIGSLNGVIYMGFFNCVIDVYPSLNCFEENDTLKYFYGFYPSCYFNSVQVEETPRYPKVQIFPNPFHDYTTLISTPDIVVDGKLVITDLQSRILKCFSGLNGSPVTIDRSGLPEGCYFYQLYSRDVQIAMGKIFIQ